MSDWYARPTAGDHQGTVIDEQTGRTIAVTYDKADAPTIARDHNAHLALLRAVEVLTLTPHIVQYLTLADPKSLEQARAARALAEEPVSL